jgi:hypothetical protein
MQEDRTMAHDLDLGPDQVRVTVRLPGALYADIRGLVPGRGVGDLLRKAVEHYLQCPERVREEAEREARRQALLAELRADWQALRASRP